MPERYIRRITWALLPIILWTFAGGPAYAALAATEQAREAQRDAARKALPRDFDDVVAELGAALRAVEADDSGALERTKSLRAEIAQRDIELRKEFADVEAMIRDKNLPAEILQRHRDFVTEYEKRLGAVQSGLDNVENGAIAPEGFIERTWFRTKIFFSGDPVRQDAAENTRSLLESYQPRKIQKSFKPEDLPFRRMMPQEGLKPKETDEEWREALADPAQTSSSLQKAAGAVADALVSPAMAQSSDLPGPADLAETIEVQFTPEIVALAAQLNNNPVEIYNWVRNNIEFVPTWGSIQGAEDCNNTKECNAFDTASLLVALLRVSGIAARYRIGTVESDAALIQQWLGGFDDAENAALLMGSGGIPTELVTVNGVQKKIRFEHVWVEAFVDYIPSGGVVDSERDRWVSLDATFKPINVTGGSSDIEMPTFDAFEYFAEAPDRSPLTHYLARVQAVLDSQGTGGSTDDIGRVVSINAESLNVLPAEIQLGLRSVAGPLSQIPDSMRVRIRIAGLAKDGMPDFSLDLPLAQLGSNTVTLSYVPVQVATASSFGGMYFVPPYLINLKPVIKVNGEERARGVSSRFSPGDLQYVTITIVEPAGRILDLISNEIQVGSYSAVVLNTQIVSGTRENDILRSRVVADESKRLVFTKNLDNSDRDRLYGTVLTALGVIYFADLDRSKAALTKLLEVRRVNRINVGMFALEASVATSAFGIPVSFAIDRLTMDVDRVADAVMPYSAAQSRAAYEFTKIAGFESSFFEHWIFDSQLSTNGISTVKGLQLARQSGVEIVSLQPEDGAASISGLSIPPDLQRVLTDALSAGRTLIAPKSQIVFDGGRVFPYIISDKSTGDAAYLIASESVKSGGYSYFRIHGLEGTTQEPPEDFFGPCVNENRPIAALVMGRGSAGDFLNGLRYPHMEKMVGVLFSAGYDVAFAIADEQQEFQDVVAKAAPYKFDAAINASGECEPILVDGEPSPRSNIFIYLGHGDISTGNLLLDSSQGEGQDIEVAPSDVTGVSEVFKIAYLAGCNTSIARTAWAESFGADINSGRVLVGHQGNIGVSAALGYTLCFPQALLSQQTVGEAIDCLRGGISFQEPYIVGDPRTRL